MADLSLENPLNTFTLEELKEDFIMQIDYICESEISNDEKSNKIISIINKITTNNETEEYQEYLLILIAQKVLDKQEIFFGNVNESKEQQNLLTQIITIDIESFYKIYDFNKDSDNILQLIFNTSYQNNKKLTISHLDKFDFIDEKTQLQIIDNLLIENELIAFLENFEKFNLIDDEILFDIFLDTTADITFIDTYLLEKNNENELKKLKNIPKKLLIQIAESKPDFALYLLKNPNNQLLTYDIDFKNKLILNIINNDPYNIHELIKIKNINLQKFQNEIYKKYIDLAYNASDSLGAANVNIAASYLSNEQRKEILNILIDKYQNDPSSILINSLLNFGMDQNSFITFFTNAIIDNNNEIDFNINYIPQEILSRVTQNILNHNPNLLLKCNIGNVWVDNMTVLKRLYESSNLKEYIDENTFFFIVQNTTDKRQIELLNKENIEVVKYIVNQATTVDNNKHDLNEYLNLLDNETIYMDLALYKKYKDSRTQKLLNWAECNPILLMKHFQNDDLWLEALNKYEEYKRNQLLSDNNIDNIKFILSLIKKGSTPNDFEFFEKALQENQISETLAIHVLNFALKENDPIAAINRFYKEYLQKDIPPHKKYWFIISNYLNDYLDTYSEYMQDNSEIKVDLFIDKETGELYKSADKVAFADLQTEEQISALVALVELSRRKSNSNKEKDKANTRNKILEYSNQLALGECFVHTTNLENLLPILKSGNVAGEILAIQGDVYPLHVDFSQITPLEQKKRLGNFNRILKATWSYFEWYNPKPDEGIEQIFILYNRHPFFSPDEDGLDPNFYNPENQFVLGAYPSTEISGIVIFENDVDTENIEQLKKYIKENGFFIPIYNEYGKILFSYEEYQEY